MNRSKYLRVALPALLLIVGGAIAQVALAACNPSQYNMGRILPPCTACGDCGISDFLVLFRELYKFGLQLLGPIGILFLIVGSVFWLAAGGSSTRIDLGKNIIRQTVTGIFIVLASWLLVDSMIFLLTGNGSNTVAGQMGKPWYTFDYSGTGTTSANVCGTYDVAQIQHNLLALGYTVTENKTCDSATEDAITNFQNDANRYLLTEARQSCSAVVWSAAFGKTCTPVNEGGTITYPADSCTVAETDVIAKTPTSVGTMDDVTAMLLLALNDSNTLTNEYSLRCRTQ